MEKEFIKYEDALVLKKLGFDEKCFGGYLKDSKELWIGYVESQGGEQFNRDYHIPVPTYQQAFRFFREKSFEFYIQHYLHTSVKYYQVYLDYEGGGTVFGKSLSYEEAESACLKKLIEICTNLNTKD